MSKKEKLSVEPYKGVRDFYPEEQAFLQYVFSTMREVAERFGYVEYHASILEPSELYRSKGSANAEIVNEQAYTFIDRGEREVTLRPEMTPTVARMVAARRRDMGFPLRLFSIPNVFRYERPQRGRLREHWQLNVDLFGSNAREADAEVIHIASSLMKAFGATDSDFVIKLGSRAFLNALIEEMKLDESQAKKLHSVLDKKAKIPMDEFTQEINDLGIALEMLSGEKVPPDVAGVLSLLKDLGVENAEFDPSIVRGFDYYSGVVFEVYDTHPDNNRSLFGGGRYDNLLALFDDEVVPAVGMGCGDVTIKEFLAVRGLLPDYISPVKVYLACPSPELAPDVMKLAEELREKGVNAAVDFGEKKLGDQIKAANKHRIPFVVVVGENELTLGTFIARNLESGAEAKLTREELSSFFLNL